MKIIFAGPTLHGAKPDLNGITLLPPAAQGDVAHAVARGANVIGLIDGVYENVAAVWHKEILHALTNGVHVLGAASMGALRAAECAAFGMDAVGEIANAYLDGTLDDDAAVAQLHGPAEVKWQPLSEALVDMDATLDLLKTRELISGSEHKSLRSSARQIFFKHRTLKSVLDQADELDDERRTLISRIYKENRVKLKQRDALTLIEKVHLLDDQRHLAPSWSLAKPAMWENLRASMAASPAE